MKNVYEDILKVFTKDETVDSILTARKAAQILNAAGYKKRGKAKSGRVKGMSREIGDWWIKDDGTGVVVIEDYTRSQVLKRYFIEFKNVVLIDKS